jgi:hypothetical protein
MNHFNYNNSETTIKKGGKIIRRVTIKKGKGYKSFTKYSKGKKPKTVRKPLHKHEIEKIKRRKFIPNLFADCEHCITKSK